MDTTSFLFIARLQFRLDDLKNPLELGDVVVFERNQSSLKQSPGVSSTSLFIYPNDGSEISHGSSIKNKKGA
jgi:hypothetical protein